MRRLPLAVLAGLVALSCATPNPTGPDAVSGGATGSGTTASASPDTPLNFVAHLVGDNEVPPRETRAQGELKLQLAPDGLSLSYRLIATNIDNVIAAHIHVGSPEVNGPVTVFLFGNAAPGGGRHNGVLAEGTITAANLIGPLAGQTLADLVALMVEGGTYVNAHTNDGAGSTNTGPGDFPGGEIRAQIQVAGPPS